MYHNFIFTPLYNALIYIFDLFPWVDAGVAVIIITVLVKVILFPLSRRAIITQARMKEIQPEMKKIQNQYKDNKQAQSLAIMQLYKDKKVNPFTSIVLIFIQLPILFALYSIFVRSGLPNVDASLLYDFVKVPSIDMHLFGYFDISKKSVFFAILAAVTQFFQIKYAFSNQPTSTGEGGFQEELMKSMSVQMKYVLPIIVLVISYQTSAVIALYWTISNIFTLVQEIIVRREIKLKDQVTTK